MEEPLMFSAWQAEINCDSVVVVIYGFKDFSLLIHGVIPILDAVGECFRFIMFLDDVYGRMSDRVFPKDHVR